MFAMAEHRWWVDGCSLVTVLFFSMFEIFHNKRFWKIKCFTVLSTGTSGQNSQNSEHQESLILKEKIIYEYGLNSLKCVWIRWCHNRRLSVSRSYLPRPPTENQRGPFLELNLHQKNQNCGEILLLKINLFLNKLHTIWKTEKILGFLRVLRVEPNSRFSILTF